MTTLHFDQLKLVKCRIKLVQDLFKLIKTTFKNFLLINKNSFFITWLLKIKPFIQSYSNINNIVKFESIVQLIYNVY
jgi:hypothetical protein